MYPQVIDHTIYNGKPMTRAQISWLKLQCPHDGSIKGLCLNFFDEVDQLIGTNYSKSYRGSRTSTETLLPHMARVASLQSIGLLIIDEIQHLKAASSGGAEKMLNFFVQLVNSINLPTILIGTYGAMEMLCSEFRQIRRACGQGDLIWDRMKNGDEWRYFLEHLWRYQYTQKRTPLTDELAETLYHQCQGIVDFACKIYFLAQIRAIATGHELVNTAIVRSVAYDSLRLAQPVLEALRTGNTRLLSTMNDVHPIDFGGVMKNYTSPLSNLPKSNSTNGPKITFPPCESSDEASDGPERETKSSRPARKRKPPQLENKLYQISREGKTKNLTPYESLKNGGLIHCTTK